VGRCGACQATTTCEAPNGTSQASGAFALQCPNCDQEMTLERRELAQLRRSVEGVAFNAFADAIGTYLTSIGWSAAVVASPRIQQQPENAASLRYELVVQFTGAKRS